MAHTTPQFNIKTGSDSQLFFSREVTADDVNAAGSDFPEEAVGRIKTGEVVQDCDIFNYPQLTRLTGHSISGSTESIESQELRKGRTKSAPRKGNSSSEGSLDIELSPQTYDDIFEAALRNKWKRWGSDANSAIKFDFAEAIKADQFISNGTQADSGLHARYLVGWMKEKDESEAGRKDAIVIFKDEAERDTFDIDELTCGTEDIKYSALTQYGGITGEDLYQEFQHLAVNTMSLSVSPGQIVTGSFGFMGSNNPDLLGENGIVEALADNKEHSKEGRFYKKDNSGEVIGMTSNEVKAWVDELANKTGTSTDQFTAREGFLYINGHRVQYGSNLTFELNNGLKQIFAIFEKGAISTAPMSLDITGTLDAYLIKGYTEDLYNMCSGDKDVEITFCFQDQEDNPNDLYVMQIFKAKFTGNDISQGSEERTVSLPFQSFGERACRFFRIRKRRPFKITLADGAGDVILSSAPKALDASEIAVTATATDKDGNVTNLAVAVGDVKEDTTGVAYTVTLPVESGDYTISVKAVYQEQELVQKYSVTVA